MVKDKEEEEIIETNMTFGVRPENITLTPQVISTLRKMRVARALSLKKIMQKYKMYKKQSQNPKNFFKKAGCFYFIIERPSL